MASVDLPEVAEKWLLDTILMWLMHRVIIIMAASYPKWPGKEFVAFEDGTEVIFDANGTNPDRTIRLKNFKNLVGTKFDATDPVTSMVLKYTSRGLRKVEKMTSEVCFTEFL